MTIKLMVTCDDCGLSQGIDQSAARLYARGMVSSGSIMTNFPHTQHAFDLFSRLDNFEMGVHLNLSDGNPLTHRARASDLVQRSGRFRNRLYLFALAMFPSQELLAVMEEELRAQIEVFFQEGLRPAHLTTHIHFHVFPAVRALVHNLANEYEVRWVRNSDFRVAVLPLIPVRTTSPTPNGTHQNFEIPDYVVMLRAYLDYPPQQMLRDILKLHGTVEIVVHPSVKTDLHYPSHVAYRPADRHRETRYLEDFFHYLRPELGRGVQIVNTMGIITAG